MTHTEREALLREAETTLARPWLGTQAFEDRALILRLASALREVAEDSERLEWLDRSWVRVQKFPHFDWMSDTTSVRDPSEWSLSPLLLREAIDAARRGEGGTDG